MRKFAKLLSLVLVVATLCSVCVFNTSAANFDDVTKDNEALYEAVELLNSLGIAKGQSETSYGTTKYVTREQMAAFIYRLMKEGRSLEGGENLTTFTDLKDSTFFGMISWASSAGIIKGVSDTQFRPGGKITLQDCFVMITRALGYEKDGPLAYPEEYLAIAERIGLSKNVEEDINYTDYINRGTVAIILHNAFYADMNETYKETFVPSFENPNVTDKGSIFKDKPESIAHKIYKIEIINRRVVATPNFAIDLSNIPEHSANADYIAYAPTGTEDEQKDYVILANVIPGVEEQRLENEKPMIAFEKLGLEGKADDYFLKDITLYMKKDGTVMATSVKGTYVPSEKAYADVRKGTDLKRDYVDSSKYDVTSEKDIEDSGNIETGLVWMGEDKAYFYNLPSSVDNYAWSLYPVADDEGRLTYKAGYTWWGDETVQPAIEEASVSFAQNRYAFMDNQRSNRNQLAQLLSVARHNSAGSIYDLEYYDCNDDGIVDYFWMKPYTFGKIVDRSDDSFKTTAKHTGDYTNRAYYNSQTHFPEIYVNGATVTGGSYENGETVFAYVSGAANIVEIADDSINDAIKNTITTPVRLPGDKNASTWKDGTRINAWNSGNIIVGHISWSYGASQTYGMSMEDDKFPWTDNYFASPWRSKLEIGQYWELYVYNGRVLWAEITEQPVDVVKQYAIVDYMDVENEVVAFEAGYIDFDATLIEDGLYVKAYINGKSELVPISKTVNGVVQDNDYFLDNNIVNEISTYTLDSQGRYRFEPFDFESQNSDTEALASDDSSNTYNVKVSDGISLAKYNDKIYQFVPAANYSDVPEILAPNGMRFVSVDSNTLIIVKYVNENDQDDFMIYSGENMPNFDVNDEAMEFSEAYIVIQNNPNSEITEKLAFLYCVIGGQIVDDTVASAEYGMIMGHQITINSDDEEINVYSTYDPITGIWLGDRVPSKETYDILPDFAIYELTETGDLKNTTAGMVGYLAEGSRDLTTVEGFEVDNRIIFLPNDNYVRVDDDTVYTLVDREAETITVIGEDVLSITAEEDEDDIYFNEGAEKLTVFIMSEDVKDEDIDLATLVIVVRG
ncbi:MAG: S-layer homology domain-containing protein [Ruminococcaceae bacterium]|nr:S-layer homology domain-containing protein [Oscillospiraceae bacterium]